MFNYCKKMVINRWEFGSDGFEVKFRIDRYKLQLFLLVVFSSRFFFKRVILFSFKKINDD